MKKISAVILLTVIVLAAYVAGRQSGIHHAIVSSEIWISEYTAPEDGNGDLLINLDLDGETYQHTVWIY